MVEEASSQEAAWEELSPYQRNAKGMSNICRLLRRMGDPRFEGLNTYLKCAHSLMVTSRVELASRVQIRTNSLSHKSY